MVVVVVAVVVVVVVAAAAAVVVVVLVVEDVVVVYLMAHSTDFINSYTHNISQPKTDYASCKFCTTGPHLIIPLPSSPHPHPPEFNQTLQAGCLRPAVEEI